jgi:Raf kinase inhibitor-like YbhB/YbcL family protein
MHSPSPRVRRRLVGVAVGFTVAIGTALAGCSSDGREMRDPTFDQNESIITTTVAPEEPVGFDTASIPGSDDQFLEISVPWSEGDRVPVQFTCAGANVSPSVAWFDVTSDAVGVAIVLYEIGIDQTVHWIVANLDPARAFIDSGELDGDEAPIDAVIGLNDASSVAGPTQGYRGPCPAPGTSATYTLEVHALGQLIELPSGTPAQDVRSAIDLVSIQRATITAYANG